MIHLPEKYHIKKVQVLVGEDLHTFLGEDIYALEENGNRLRIITWRKEENAPEKPIPGPSQIITFVDCPYYILEEKL